MKPNIAFLSIIGLFTAVFFLNCTSLSRYNLTLKNTLSVFLIEEGTDQFFSIPIQYIGDYQIESFEFNNGFINIGDYKILLEKDELEIDVYVNESSDEYGHTEGLHNMVYSERNGRTLLSKMAEPLAKNHEYDTLFNQYNIFIKKNLKNNEIKNINSEYEKGNTYSLFFLEYTITLDNEQMECGYSDDFELYNGQDMDSAWFPPNLEFFRTMVLQK
jgi:hypothetical protein